MHVCVCECLSWAAVHLARYPHPWKALTQSFTTHAHTHTHTAHTLTHNELIWCPWPPPAKPSTIATPRPDGTAKLGSSLERIVLRWKCCPLSAYRTLASLKICSWHEHMWRNFVADFCSLTGQEDFVHCAKRVGPLQRKSMIRLTDLLLSCS